MPCAVPCTLHQVTQRPRPLFKAVRVLQSPSHTRTTIPRRSNESPLIGLIDQSRNTRATKCHTKIGNVRRIPDMSIAIGQPTPPPLTQPKPFPGCFPSKIACSGGPRPESQETNILRGLIQQSLPIYDSITTPGRPSLSTSSVTMSTKTEPPDPISPSAESDVSADVELCLGTEGVASEQLERIRSKLSLQDQSSRLPLRQVLIIFFGLAVSLMLSFLDMTCVSTALPTIARDFNAATEVSWVGTSFLIANTSMQILYGRLSDVFGRKVVLMSAIGLFAVGNLLCGFSQSMVWSCRSCPLTLASFNLSSFEDFLEPGEEGLSV